jgi:hypothetical protein
LQALRCAVKVCAIDEQRQFFLRIKKHAVLL